MDASSKQSQKNKIPTHWQITNRTFPISSSQVWMSWAIKKVELGRIHAFKLGCWRRLLRVPWTARRSNQSILKDTLATWCEEPTHWKRPWRWERLKAGGEGDDRGWDGWMASPIQWTWIWVSSRRWWRTGRPGVLQSMGSQSNMGTRLSTWTPKCASLRLAVQMSAVPGSCVCAASTSTL